MVDTLTAIVSASKISKHGSVSDIDKFIQKLDELCKSLNKLIIFTAQLKRPEVSNFVRNGEKTNINLDWSEGREPTMNDIKGSGGIEQKPDVIIAIARNSKDENSKNKIKLFVLKNRWAQDVGFAGTYEYITKTGRLI